MQEADPALVAALGEADRQNTSLTRLGGHEVTAQVTSWSLDRAYDTDLPAPMRATNGAASAELRLTLSGEGEPGATAAQLYSPYAPHATADIARPRQSVLHGWGVADDALPAFRGTVRDRTADSGTGTLDLSALDGAERLRDAARLPVAVSTNSAPISSGTWVVDHLLRDAGIHTAPPPRPECILYASLHGGVTPDIGFYRDHIANGMQYRRDRTPWEISAVAGLSPYTIRWDPRTRTTVPGRSLFAEFWVDRTIGSAGSRVQLSLFYQADNAVNSVVFWFDFATDQMNISANGTGGSVKGDGGIGLLSPGRYHIGVFWNWSIDIPFARYYVSGPGVLGGFKERDMGSFPAMPATQLNYIELVSALPCESVQVSRRDARLTEAEFNSPWQRGAVLDEVGSQLSALPPTAGSAWEVIGEVAKAEQSTAQFDEWGVFRYKGNLRFTFPGQPVLTVTTAREIASLRVSEAIDSVRNVIDVPYSTFTAGTSSTRFSDTTIRQVNAFGTLVVTYDYDVSEYDSPPPVLYSAVTPSNTSRVRFSSQTTNGNVGVHGAVESTTERDGNQLTITLRNRTGNNLFLVTGTGTPSLSIASVQLAQGSPSRFTSRRYSSTSRDLYGAQVYQVPATPWIQSFGSAVRVADYLLSVARTPLPTLGDVEILPDPRVQLGDLVRVIDTVGAALSTPAWVVGIKTSGDGTGRVGQVLTLRATQSPGPPSDTGLFPDPPIDPDARAQLLREGVKVP